MAGIPMKNKLRMPVDMGMMILMLLLMAYSLVGEMPHEVLGITIFALFIIHHSLNFSWWKSLFKGKYTPARILQTLVNLLLVLVMFLQPLSGIAMSKHLFPWLNMGIPSQVSRMVHLLLANWGFVLMSLHLGFHLNVMKHRMGLSKMPVWLGRIVSLVIVLLGARAFVVRGLWGYLTYKTQFVFFDFSEPVILFLLDYLCIMGLFAVLGNQFYKGNYI